MPDNNLQPRIAGYRMRTLSPDGSFATPQILCFVDGEGIRDAELAESFADVADFIEGQWLGEPGRLQHEENAVLRDEVSARPDTWGEGTGQLFIDIEPGISYIELTVLGEVGTWRDEWVWP